MNVKPGNAYMLLLRFTNLKNIIDRTNLENEIAIYMSMMKITT